LSTDTSIAGQLLTVASADDRVDLVCDAFEEAWIHGGRPSIEQYLNDFPAPERGHLFAELLLLDVDYRRRDGDRPLASEYATRFPGFSVELEAAILSGGFAQDGDDEASPQFSSSISAGGRIAHFELIEKIGRGAAGVLWKAKDLRLQRFAALKIPHSRLQTDEEFHRFLREGRAAAQLRHPNIVAVYETGRVGDTAYLVADFIDGPNLSQWLAGRVMPPRQAAELCALLAEALHCAHEQGVVHRDLKPANIILNRNGQPHITDFGLAKWAEDSRGITLDGQLLGTPCYMSPEQARGEAARVDPRADVFALGVILYETCTGKRPFDGPQSAVIDAILRREPARPRALNHKIPRDLETICLKALEKDTGRRYATAQEMAVDLRRFLRGEPIVARRTGAIVKGWTLMKRRPAIAAMMALGLTSLASLSMAGRFARKNRELIGLQTVTLDTVPSGARIAFVPLSDSNGQPIPARLVRPDERSPVSAVVAPGDYIVVAALDDGRFHEVFRHVPRDASATPGGFEHLYWKTDASGNVCLPAIKIPQLDVSAGMVRIDVSESLVRHGEGAATLRQAFFLDATEFTYGEYKRKLHNGTWPKKYKNDPPPENRSLRVTYDVAVAYAERLGKRLPTDDEYALAINAAATDATADRFAASLDARNSELPDGGDAALNRLRPVAAILGLCSGTPEWTSSSALAAERPQTLAVINEWMPQRFYRVVRGAGSSGPSVIQAKAAEMPGQLDVRSVMERTVADVGFRCARSARPRYLD
jgi:serine/threonine-protein kinase